MTGPPLREWGYTTDNPQYQATHPHGSASRLKCSPPLSLSKDSPRLPLLVVRARVFPNQLVRGEMSHLIPCEDPMENSLGELVRYNEGGGGA